MVIVNTSIFPSSFLKNTPCNIKRYRSTYMRRIFLLSLSYGFGWPPRANVALPAACPTTWSYLTATLYAVSSLKAKVNFDLQILVSKYRTQSPKRTSFECLLLAYINLLQNALTFQSKQRTKSKLWTSHRATEEEYHRHNSGISNEKQNKDPQCPSLAFFRIKSLAFWHQWANYCW